MSETTRRDFLKVTGAAAAGTTVDLTSDSEVKEKMVNEKKPEYMAGVYMSKEIGNYQTELIDSVLGRNEAKVEHLNPPLTPKPAIVDIQPEQSTHIIDIRADLSWHTIDTTGFIDSWFLANSDGEVLLSSELEHTMDLSNIDHITVQDMEVVLE